MSVCIDASAIEPGVEQLRAEVKAAEAVAVATSRQAAQLSATAGRDYTPAEGGDVVSSVFAFISAYPTLNE